MLDWQWTVHKVHDRTLEEIVFNFNLLKQKQFNYGKMYVALRRLTSLRGLHLTGKFEVAAIRSDPMAVKQYHTVWTNM